MFCTFFWESKMHMSVNDEKEEFLQNDYEVADTM